METKSQSERVIAALKQLQQFQGVLQQDAADGAINVLTGARVTAVPDPEEEDHGLLEVTFPGAVSFRVTGSHYLELQIIEDSRLIIDGPEGVGNVSKRMQGTSEHFIRKYGIE